MLFRSLVVRVVLVLVVRVGRDQRLLALDLNVPADGDHQVKHDMLNYLRSGNPAAQEKIPYQEISNEALNEAIIILKFALTKEILDIDGVEFAMQELMGHQHSWH